MFIHTGVLDKGGSIITVNGDNFVVEGKRIEVFSYNGINCGLDVRCIFKTVVGIIRKNIIDNTIRKGDARTQLYDGGAINIYPHTNSVLVENNFIRGSTFQKDCVLASIKMEVHIMSPLLTT